MPSTTLRLYRGDAATAADAITRDTAAGEPRDTAAGEPRGTAVADRPETAPRVLPFPGRRDEADETARATSGGTAYRFHTAHDAVARDGGTDDAGEEADDSFGTGVFDLAGGMPDVLPLSSILSPPAARGGYAVPGTAPQTPADAIAGRVGAAGGWVDAGRRAPAAGSTITRAKALHANRTCTACGAGGVEPVLLNDGVRDAAGDLVPGSGTLVGFHCARCEAEWPVA